MKVTSDPILYTDSELAVFFWVRDSEEAIFSYSCKRPRVGMGEVSFRTTDPKIIDALLGIYEKAQSDAINLEASRGEAVPDGARTRPDGSN